MLHEIELLLRLAW